MNKLAQQKNEFILKARSRIIFVKFRTSFGCEESPQLNLTSIYWVPTISTLCHFICPTLSISLGNCNSLNPSQPLMELSIKEICLTSPEGSSFDSSEPISLLYIPRHRIDPKMVWDCFSFRIVTPSENKRLSLLFLLFVKWPHEPWVSVCDEFPIGDIF